MFAFCWRASRVKSQW